MSVWGGAESRAGDRLWSSKESTGVEMSRFMPGYFSLYIHPPLLTFLTNLVLNFILFLQKCMFLTVLISHIVPIIFQYPHVYGK